MMRNADTQDWPWRAALLPEEARLAQALDACGVTFRCAKQAGRSLLQALDLDGVPLAQVDYSSEAGGGPVSELLGRALAQLDLVL